VPLSTAVIVLAAGSGTRMSAHGTIDKMLAIAHGRPVVDWTLSLLCSVLPEPGMLHVIVRPESSPALRHVIEQYRACCVECSESSRGIAWSLACGLASCPESVDGALVLLGDDPLAALAAADVMSTVREHPNRIVAVKRDHSAPHPVYLPRSVWHECVPETAASSHDVGMGALLKAPASNTLWITSTAPTPIDADDQTSLAELANALSVFTRSTKLTLPVSRD